MEETDRQRETVVAKHPKLRVRTESKTSRKASRRGATTASSIPLPSPTSIASPLMSPAPTSSLVSALRIPTSPRSAVVKTSLQTIVAPRTRHTHHHHHRGGRSRGHRSRRHQSARSAPSVAESGARFAGGDPPVQERDPSPLALQSSKTQVITADAPAQTLTTITTRASQNILRAVSTQPLSNKGSGTAFVPQSNSQECVESMATSDGQLLCGWDQSLGVVLLQPPSIWNKDSSLISQQSVVPYVSSMLPNFSVWPCYIAPSEAACSTYASPALYGSVDGGLKCRPPSGGKGHTPSSGRGVPRRLYSRPRPRACSPSFCVPSRRHVSPSRRTCSPHRRLFSPPRHPCSPISCYRRRCTSPAESCRSRSRTPARIPYQPISCSPRTPCRTSTPPPCRQIVLSCRMHPRSRSPPCRGRSPTSPRRGHSPRYGYSPERRSARRQRLGPEPIYHRSRHPCDSQSPMRPPLSSPPPSLPPCSAEHRATQTRSREVYDTRSDSCCSERRELGGPAGGGLLCRARSHRSLHCAAGDYSVRGRGAENYLRSYNSCCPATDQAAWIKFIMRFLQSDELNKAVRCWMQESLNCRGNRSSRQRYFCRRHSSSSAASCIDEAPCHTSSPPPFRPRSRSACRPISPTCYPSRPRSRSVCNSRTCGRSHSPPRRSLTPPCRSLTPPCRARTPPCRPRTPPCRPRTPPCRPRTPPCRPRTPPCRPRTPPCRPRTPPCRPRTPPCPRSPCRPRTPPCRPRTPPCRPRTPPCGPRTTPCRPRTPPCIPHTPPPCHSCTLCHQITTPCQSRSSSHPRTPPCASCQSCRPCTPPSDPPCSKECKPCRTCDMCPPQPKTCATCKLPCTSQGTTQTSLVVCSRPASRSCWGPCIPARDCCSTSMQACPREAPSSCPSGSSTVMGGACFGRVPSPPMAPSPPPCMPPPPPCVPPPPPPPGRPPPPSMATQQTPCHIRPTPMCNFRSPQPCTQIALRPQQSPCPGPPPQCNQPQCGPPQCRPQQCCQPQCTLTPCNAAQVGLQQLSGSTAGAVVPFRNAFNELALSTQIPTNQRSGGGPVWQSPTTLFQMTVPGPPGGPPVTCTPQPPAMSYCPMRVMYDAMATSVAPCKPSEVPCINAPPNNFGAKICCPGGGNSPGGQQGGGSQGTQHNQSCCRHANMLSGPALRLLDELGPMQGPFGRAPFAPPPIPHCTRLKGPCLPRDGTSQQMNNSSVFNEGSMNDVTKLGAQQKMGSCPGRGMCCACSGGGGCVGCRQAPMSCYPGPRSGPGAGSDADCPCTAAKGPPIDFFRPLEPMVRSQCSSRSSVDAGSPSICPQNCSKICCVNAPRGTSNLRASLAARETTLGGDSQMSRRSCLPKRPSNMRPVNAGGQEN